MNEVANFFGYSIGIGFIVSAITEIIKFTERVPFLSKVGWVNWIVQSIEKGNPVQIRIGVATLCVLLNTISFFVNGGEVTDMYQFLMGLTGAFSSFMTALGAFDLIFKPAEKKISGD